MFTDLHSNLPALEAMVDKFASRVDLWLCAGDSVGLFPQINETLTLQQKLNVKMVLGDHEKLLLSGEDMTWSYSGNQALKAQRRIITKSNLEYLSSLPEQSDFHLDGLHIRLVHDASGSIRYKKDKYNIEPETINQQHVGVDYLLAGHTHMTTMLYTSSLIYLNPGSAGFPADIRCSPCMLLFDTVTQSHEFVTFDFDRNLLKLAIVKENYNPKLIKYLDNNFKWV